MKELHLKYCVHIAILFLRRQILIHLRHWDQNKQKDSPFIPTSLLPTPEFSKPLFVKTPLFIQDLRVGCNFGHAGCNKN